jgi:hypothetical protein
MKKLLTTHTVFCECILVELQNTLCPLGTSVATTSSNASLSKIRDRAAEYIFDGLFIIQRGMDQLQSARRYFSGALTLLSALQTAGLPSIFRTSTLSASKLVTLHAVYVRFYISLIFVLGRKHFKIHCLGYPNISGAFRRPDMIMVA